MADSEIRIGGKIRKLRREAGLSQAALAEQLDVSASYLNLIEHNKRRLTAAVLLRLADVFEIEAAHLAEDGEGRLLADVMDVLGDDLFEDMDIATSDARALIEASPNAARAMLHLHGAYRKAQSDIRTMAVRSASAANGENGPYLSRVAPAEAISDFIQDKQNYFEDLEVEAERLGREIADTDHRTRETLTDFLRRAHGVETVVVRPDQDAPFQRRYDPERKTLFLSERLSQRSRRFQTAYQIGLLAARPVIEMLLTEGRVRDGDTRALGRSALANYFAAALLMPYDRFLESAEEARYDIDLLRHRFGAGFEQVCHRLTSLNRPGRSGVPLHMLRVDMAGNISKRFSLSGLPIPRHGEACARWNVYASFLRPGDIQAQLSELPDGARYFCIARTVRKAGGGFGRGEHTLAIGLGCEEKYASRIVYADATVLGAAAKPAPIGVNCRICDRLDCAQRAQPPVHLRTPLDENIKGLSPFTFADQKAAPRMLPTR
ncbi:MAG: short-chain fatty acyl-CoA regulator family protein [Alphaproteobacteria bacterium]|nr:short-chain fatty acyl-CoA regulator family protein [Alphaproteobacteria bacterium]